MDVTDVVRRLARLRLALATVVALAIIAAVTGWVTAGKSTQSGAAVAILAPKVSSVAGGENPFLALDNNLAQFAVLLSTSLRSDEVATALAADGASADWTVSTTTGDNPSFAQLAPQLIFVTTSPDAAVTEATARALVDQTRSRLQSLQQQAGVPAAQRATLLVVTAPTAAVTVSGGRLRAGGSLGLGVLLLGLIALLIVDSLPAMRRRREAGTAGSAGTATDTAADHAAADMSPGEPLAGR